MLNRYVKELGMDRVISVLIVAMFCTGTVFADESSDVATPPEIVLDAPPPEKEAKQQQEEW